MAQQEHPSQGEQLVGDLRRSAACLDGILQSAMDAMITIDDDYNIVIFNPAAEQMFGYLAAEVVGSPLDMLLPQRYREAHRRHIAYFATTGITSRRMGGLAEITGCRRNGDEFPVEGAISQTVVEGRTLQTVILRDVTGRKQVEQALRESAERYRRLVELVPDAIWIERDAQVRFANRTCLDLLGAGTQAEVIGRSPLDFLHPDCHEAALRRRQGLLQDQEGSLRADMIVVRLDGTQRHVEIAEATFHDAGRIAILTVLHDVTERRRAEQQMRHSRQQLRELSASLQSVREAEKTRIARELHDELGQALTGLKMDLAEIGTELRPDQAVALARAADMKALIESTVAAVRRIATELRPLMLDDLGLEATVEWLTKDFAQRTGMTVDLDLPGAGFEADAEQSIALFRVLQEALTNVARHARAQHVRVQLGEDAEAIWLCVSDDGQGMPAAAPGPRPLTFGLLGMRERATMLGGSLEIESEAGAGTQVSIRIPRHAPAPPWPRP